MGGASFPIKDAHIFIKLIRADGIVRIIHPVVLSCGHTYDCDCHLIAVERDMD